MARNRIVKVRVTEAEYSDWVQQAVEGSVSLSEAIRRAMEPGSHSGPGRPLESLTRGYGYWSSSPPLAATSKVEYISTNIEGGSLPILPIRRSEACSHSRPAYAFCPECDK